MDTLTHALSGALFARARTGDGDAAQGLSVRARVSAGFAACAFPDIDFVVGFLGPVHYLEHHRGITHSLIMMPLWALLLAWLFSRIARDARGWRPWYGVAALGLTAHIAGDVITGFGTIVFAPFSDWRVALGTTFIIDPWFTGIIVLGLISSALWRGSRVPAVAASVVLCAYIGAQWMLKQQAIEFGARYAAAQGLTDAQIDAHPRPVSPFNWTVFVSDAGTHRYAHVNLVRSAPRMASESDGLFARLDAAYQPLSLARWETRTRFGSTLDEQRIAREAWQSAALGFYRWFAAVPAFDGATSGTTRCIWFKDLRFLVPGREAIPFRYGACRDESSHPAGNAANAWRAFQRIGEGGGIPVN